MKTFGSHTRQPAPREPFELRYLDANEDPQVFTGQIVIRASGSDLATLLRQVKLNSEESVPTIVRMLTKVMDDKDGLVSSRWSPTPLPIPEDWDPESDGDWEPAFRGPDGTIYALSDEPTLAKFNDPANWTTRRRWIELMEKDDDAVVELDELMAIMEWQIGLAADRPTRPRA